tara:strand:+ start:3448 stop:4059 length:612 start_codon:yes stop_codon:yes gene_type:complete
MQNGRLVNLVTNQRTLLIENTESSTIPWTVYTNCTSTDGLSILVEIELLNVGYGTSTDIQYTIGGTSSTGVIVGTGDYYTGVGACRIFATSPLQPNSISVSFAVEQATMYIPPISQQLTGGIIGSVINIGYPPFSRYLCNIYSQGSYTVQWRNDAAAVIYGFVIVTPTDKIRMSQGFYHNPNLKLELISTAVNQIYSVTHFQK